MNRKPSMKRLCETFRITPDAAKDIRRVLELTDDPDEFLEWLETHPSTIPSDVARAYVAGYHPSAAFQAWNTSTRLTLALEHASSLLELFGVESLGECEVYEGPPYVYVNSGDTYAATLIYNRDTDSVTIGDIGTVIENDRRIQ